MARRPANGASAVRRARRPREVIDRLQRRSAARDDVLGLAAGLPAQSLFPRAAIATATLRVLGHGDCAALQYGWPEGATELREWIAARLRARGAPADADDVIVTSGAQQALALVVETSLHPDDRISVDAESYPAALELFRAHRVVPTASEEAGAAYLMPGVTNPRGVAASADRVQRLLASNAVLIADEAYVDLRFDGSVPPPLFAAAPDRVFHVGTFSKTLCPGFRIGWLVPPRARRGDILRSKSEADLQANSLSQAILVELFRRYDYDAHLERARRVYARRADALLCALERWLPSFRVQAPEGGFSVFVESDGEGDDVRFLEVATAHGVTFDPGCLFRFDGRASPVSFRLCHSSVQLRAIDEAVKRLGRAWFEYSRGATRRVG
jgi:2-aminoadipate transaminase